jgi:polyhydroxybutyrate depolymerase
MLRTHDLPSRPKKPRFLATRAAASLFFIASACSDQPADTALHGSDAAAVGDQIDGVGDSAVAPDVDIAPHDAAAPDGDTQLQADATGEPPWKPPASIGGAKRSAAVMFPSGYDGNTPIPTVVLMAGYDWRASELDAWWQLSQWVNDLGFALVLAEGTRDNDGSPFWNATDTCCDYDESGVDDVAYLKALFAEARQKWPVAQGRVVLFGHSNGAFMAYRMACEDPSSLWAVVSVAGSGFVDPNRCVAPAPVRILQVHGADDDVMPFVGDDEAPGALEMVQRWAERCGCTEQSPVEHPQPLTLVSTGPGEETRRAGFGSCVNGTFVELWTLHGVDHYPEFTGEGVRTLLSTVLSGL